MKDDILRITEEAKFKCGITHYPAHVPVALFEYITKLKSLKRAQIISSLNEMAKGTNACFEGKLGLIVEKVYKGKQ